MRTSVKFCGLTSAADAVAAAEAGADYLGFVFFSESRRCVLLDDTAWIRDLNLPAKVGVFRDQDPDVIRQIRDRAGLQLIQLHGEESPELCARLGGRELVIKAIPIAGAVDWKLVDSYRKVARILFDTASPTGGGTGRTFDWGLLDHCAPDGGFWLAGGLGPENVGEAIARLRPAGVDCASGIERQVGRKDPDRMRAFVAAARAARGEEQA